MKRNEHSHQSDAPSGYPMPAEERSVAGVGAATRNGHMPMWMYGD